MSNAAIPISANWNGITGEIWSTWEELKAESLFCIVCWEYTAPVHLVLNMSHAVIEGVRIGYNSDGICVSETFGMEHSYLQEYYVPKKQAYLTNDIDGAVRDMLGRAYAFGRLKDVTPHIQKRIAAIVGESGGGA